MQGDSRSEVIKSIFKDITNLQEVIDETKTVQNKYENEEADINKEALDGYITSTKKIVTSLKDSVDKIHNYFDENFKDWTGHAEVDPKVDFSSSVGKIKLVDLSKLIDPSRTINLEAASEENDAIVILSDSGSDEPVAPPKRKSRRNSINNNLYEPDNKGGRRNSRSILKSRINGVDSSIDSSLGNKESTPDRVTKKVQFASKDTVILSNITNKSSSSSSESEEEVIRAPMKRSCREKSRKTVISSDSSDSSEDDDEYEVPDDDTELQLDKKFSWRCTVDLTRIPAEKLKSKYNRKIEDKEMKRLTSWKSLKRSHSKKSDSSSDTSDSVKNPKKKRRTKGTRKSKSSGKSSSSSSSDSDSSKSSSNSSVKKGPTIADVNSPHNENVDLSINEVILNTIEAPEENSGTATEKDCLNGKIDKAGDSDKSKAKSTKSTESVDKDSHLGEKERNPESDKNIEQDTESVDKGSVQGDIEKNRESEKNKEQDARNTGSDSREKVAEEKEDKENSSKQGNCTDAEDNSEKETSETPKNKENTESNDSLATAEGETDKRDKPNTPDNSDKKKLSEGNKSGNSSSDDTDDSKQKKRTGNGGGDRRKKAKNTDSDNTSDSSSSNKDKKKSSKKISNKGDEQKITDDSSDNKKSSESNKSGKSSSDDTDDDSKKEKRIGNGRGDRGKKADDSDNTSDSSSSNKDKEKKLSKKIVSDDDDKKNGKSEDSDDDKKKKTSKDAADVSDDKKESSVQENSTDAESNSEKETNDKVDDISNSKESSKLNDSTTTKETEVNKDDKLNKSDNSNDEKKSSDGNDKHSKSSSDDSDNNRKKKKRTGNSRGDRRRRKDVTDSDDTSDSDRPKKEKKKKPSKKTIEISDDEDEEKNGKSGDSSDKKKNSKNDSNSDESDDEKKKKSKWKKDKLLTSQLLESDEEFEAFKKKKERLKAKEAESDSDSSPKPLSKKKKGFKKKRSKLVISDSDSDNYKKASSSSSSTESSESNNKNSSSDSEEEKKKQEDRKKKSRKRIKRVNSSSDEDGDKSTRKQIRKVLTKDSLSETTIQAEKDEAERKARILERQKKYNNIFEEDKLEKATLDKVVLDFNEETREELLVVDKSIVKNLKPHQGKGVQFMWDACFESIDRAKNTAGSGCILAHCMGLGKTLQVITLVHTLIKNQEKTGVEKVLVVCPLSTVLNWVAEFKKWLPDDDVVEVFDLVAYKQNRERIYQTMEWNKHGGVLVLGYDMFRNLTNENNKRLPKKLRNDFKTALVDPGPDLVVCDEGHLLKNEKTSLSISMNRLKTARRIVLTGTPLQNNLKEYWCMVQFVKPNLLGTYKEYLNRFVNPIVNGQYTDSTPHDIQIMRKRSHVLHKMLDGVVQRRDYSVLAPFLPPKCEYVVFIKLTETQVKLYTHYMREFARKPSAGGGKSYIFVDFQELQRICTHPRVLLDKSIKNRIEKEKKDWENDDESEGSLKDFIDDGSDAESTPNDSSSGGSSNESDNKKDKSNKYQRRTRAMAEQEPESEVEEVVMVDPLEWWRQYTPGDELDNIIHSGKLHLLFEILQQCEVIGDKVLVFSQSLYSLNVIEYFLSKIDEATQNNDTSLVGGYSGSWSLGLDYFRLDGSSSCDNRAAWCKTFNDPSNTRARLFLISTRAGGLGINLVAANRVIIFDVSWNPSHDIQSIYRVYRFGQTKPSYIYRFVTLGTMEMKIYERQVIKQAISKRVIDEQQIDRHYNQNDLAELYKFEPVPEGDRPIPLVPKDILLGELLQNYENLIYKYHEHQSLLENKEDEVLDEAERKAAWEEFENEKKNRQFTANFRGMIGNSFQLPIPTIVAALTNIIRREHPTFTMLEIQGVIPQLLQEFNGQMAAGESAMYMKVITEIERMQMEQQQAKIAEFYKLQQQQQALRLFQKYQSGSNLPQAQPEFSRYLQQMSQGQPQNFNQPSNSRRQANLNMDPNEVVSLDD